MQREGTGDQSLWCQVRKVTRAADRQAEEVRAEHRREMASLREELVSRAEQAEDELNGMNELD